VKKGREGRLAIGGLIALAFWTFVVLPFLYSPNEARHDGTSNKCSTEQSKNYGFWEKAACDPVAYFTLWLVGFTGVLAVSTIGLWGVTAWGVYRQQRDTEILQRAYLNVEARGVSPAIGNPKEQIVAHIAIRNTGRLPAREVSWSFEREFSNCEHREDFPAPRDFYGSHNIITSASVMVQGTVPLRFEDGWDYLYVWGVVNYTDGFDRPRTVEYCHRYNCKRFETTEDGGHRIARMYGRYHEHGNNADKG